MLQHFSTPAQLNVLPPPSAPSKKGEGRISVAAADFAALELLRRLAFGKQVPPPPDLPEQFLLALGGSNLEV